MSFKIKKILLAVTDAGAKKAIVRAAQIARKSNAQIELFSAVRPAGGLAASKAQLLRVSRAKLEEKLAELEGVARRLREDGIKVSCQAELEYSAAEAILGRVKELKPDLVVIEAHKHNLLARLMLSQTDFELIRHCAAPLIVKNAPAPQGRPVVLAALDPWHASGKPANLDAHICDVAHGMARGLGAKLHGVHVHAPLMRYEADSIMAPVVVPVPPQEQKRHLAAVRTRFRAEGRRYEIAPQNLHLRLGDPGLILPALVRSLKIDTLVMGAVSRSAVTRVLIGNTAERVLDALPCNALIVKPKSFRGH
jgi:universal stress protein E